MGSRLCYECLDEDGIYCCKDCFQPSLLCGQCMLKGRSSLPFHRILVSPYLITNLLVLIRIFKQWETKFFWPTSLQRLGMVINFGHDTEQCPPPDMVIDFVIVDVSGIHLVNIAFCHCFKGGLTMCHKQLLRARLLLASFKVPQAAFTFEVLETFH